MNTFFYIVHRLHRYFQQCSDRSCHHDATVAGYDQRVKELTNRSRTSAG